MVTAAVHWAVIFLAASFADKMLMVILGLSIVVPTLFLVVAVLVSRRGDFESEPDNSQKETGDKPL